MDDDVTSSSDGDRSSDVTFLPLDELRHRRSVKWRTYDDEVLPLWVAEMDVAPAPAIADALRTAVRRGDTGYVHRGALPERYAAFSADHYGWAPAPSRTSLVPDVMAGIAAALRLATAPGDGVVINPPVYPPFREFIGYAGREPVEVPLLRDGERYTIDLDGLDHAFADGAAAYLLCSPHNPTGSVWTREQLTAVADLAARYEVLVLADEVHAPLTRHGVGHLPFLSLDRPAAQRAVAFVAASKAWNLPGLKTALALAGPDARRSLCEFPQQVQIQTGLFGVIAAVAAFSEGVSWLSALRTHLDANHRLLAELLAAHLPSLHHDTPEATYLAWVDCRHLGLGDDPAASLLAHSDVALTSGTPFGAGGRGFVRINLGTSAALITEAVRRMSRHPQLGENRS
ncbi:MAG: aminotransferase class I/II-fold pyridoxal phosphate-dependent enzyme [Actinobacteria bacterium]|nr:aminotransferase class I/II-fold pyridoxal phosphate-dependent enzyme [Actinomycetota bacterium]